MINESAPTLQSNGEHGITLQNSKMKYYVEEKYRQVIYYQILDNKTQQLSEIIENKNNRY